MKNLKIIFAIMAVTSLGLLAPSHAFGLPGGVDAKGLADTVNKSGAELKAYYAGGKDTSLITDPKLKKAVETLCSKGCNRLSCKVGKVKTACKKACHADKVKNCLAA